MNTVAAEGRLRPRGSNHVGMRQFNERVVPQAIGLNGRLPKAGIAQFQPQLPARPTTCTDA